MGQIHSPRSHSQRCSWFPAAAQPKCLLRETTGDRQHSTQVVGHSVDLVSFLGQTQDTGEGCCSHIVYSSLPDCPSEALRPSALSHRGAWGTSWGPMGAALGLGFMLQSQEGSKTAQDHAQRTLLISPCSCPQWCKAVMLCSWDRAQSPAVTAFGRMSPPHTPRAQSEGGRRVSPCTPE